MTFKYLHQSIVADVVPLAKLLMVLSGEASPYPTIPFRAVFFYVYGLAGKI